MGERGSGVALACAHQDGHPGKQIARCTIMSLTGTGTKQNTWQSWLVWFSRYRLFDEKYSERRENLIGTDLNMISVHRVRHKRAYDSSFIRTYDLPILNINPKPMITSHIHKEVHECFPYFQITIWPLTELFSVLFSKTEIFVDFLGGDSITIASFLIGHHTKS